MLPYVIEDHLSFSMMNNHLIQLVETKSFWIFFHCGYVNYFELFDSKSGNNHNLKKIKFLGANLTKYGKVLDTDNFLIFLKKKEGLNNCRYRLSSWIRMLTIVKTSACPKSIYGSLESTQSHRIPAAAFWKKLTCSS